MLPTAAGSTCAAALATRGHTYALCSCESLSAPARIRSDSFDSRATQIFDESRAALGINGDLTSTAEVRAGGALHVAGAGGIQAQNHVRTAGSLRVGGPLTIWSDQAEAGTDAYVNGNVTGDVRVNGTLHVPAAATVDAQARYTTLVNEAVAVAPPCDCAAGFADAAGAIAAAATANADPAIGLAPSALSSVTTPQSIDLPCGTFYLDEIDAQAALTIAVHGRTLLAVGGDVTVGAFTIALDPNAELDLLVGGGLTASGGGAFGAPAAPARFRLWIGGTRTALFDDAPLVSAVIHAPLAAVTAPSGLPLSGSVLARAIMIGADSTLHFDRAILEAGTVCGAPAAVSPP
jgi:hypothetical protein